MARWRSTRERQAEIWFLVSMVIGLPIAAALGALMGWLFLHPESF